MNTAFAPALPLTLTSADSTCFTLALADASDREHIARELGQHAVNSTARLRDPVDDYNIFLVARVAIKDAATQARMLSILRHHS